MYSSQVLALVTGLIKRSNVYRFSSKVLAPFVCCLVVLAALVGRAFACCVDRTASSPLGR